MKRPEPAELVGSAADEGIEPIVALTPPLRCDEALKQIHRELLRRLEENEEGVRRRLGGEYLHDFRVAVRRTRTGLNQLPHVYPEEARAHFAEEFRWLSTLTSPARDLEVYLDACDEFRAALGAEAMDALIPFFDFLRGHEGRERTLCTRALESERYRSLVAGWADFLAAAPEGTDGPLNAARPVEEVAAARIAKAFHRVARRGAGLEPRSPALAFHRLRLDCKKLRYLLEFFAGLFDGDEGASAVRALRDMQDALGSINDLRVQAQWLQRYPGPETDATLSLLRAIEKRQAAEREAFLQGFAAFVARDSELAIERFLRSGGTTH